MKIEIIIITCGIAGFIVLIGIIACLLSQISCLELKIKDYEEEIEFIKNRLNEKQLSYFESCKKVSFPFKIDQILSVALIDKETNEPVYVFNPEGISDKT